MTIFFENEVEKEKLSHILTEFFYHSDDDDPLRCSTTGCDWEKSSCKECIQMMINAQLRNGHLNLSSFGSKDIQDMEIKDYAQEYKDFVKRLVDYVHTLE